MEEERVTPQFLSMFRFFYYHSDDWHNGSRVMNETQLSSGTVYPLLVRMHTAGWLDRRLEDIDPEKEERLQRRFYRISDHGHSNAKRYLREPSNFPVEDGVGFGSDLVPAL